MRRAILKGIHRTGNRMKYGIVGYGGMGRIRRNAMNRIGAGEPAKIYSYEPVEDGSVPVVSDPFEVINDPELDAVIICTPNFLNKKFTIAALEAGKHVFCEKPPAFNAQEVEEIIEAEKKSKRILIYGFNHREHGAAKKIHELVNSGQYGKVLWMRGRYGKSVDENYFSTWRAKPEMAGGGILIDQGIHMVDLFLHIGGNFDEIHAFVSSLYWNLPGIEDNVFAIMRNSQTGMSASLHSTMTQWRHLFSFEVFLEAGYMVLNGLKTPSGTYGAEELAVAANRTKAPAATWQDEERFLYEVDHSWANEMARFCDCIQKSASDLGDSKDALRVMRVIDRIYKNERFESEQLHNNLETRVNHD